MMRAAIGPAIAPFLMSSFKPVGMFIVTATFHGALAVSTFLRMRVRPSRRARRGRFQPIFTDKGQSPELVTLDPRSDETHENLPRTAPADSLAAEQIVTTVQPAGVTIIEPEVLAEAVDAEKDAKAEVPTPASQEDKG